jgi:hypothetical protein
MAHPGRERASRFLNVISVKPALNGNFLVVP